MLGLGHHPPRTTPTLPRQVDELFEQPGGASRLLVLGSCLPHLLRNLGLPFLDQHRQQRIVPQLPIIVQIFVSQGQTVDSLGHQLFHPTASFSSRVYIPTHYLNITNYSARAQFLSKRASYRRSDTVPIRPASRWSSCSSGLVPL